MPSPELALTKILNDGRNAVITWNGRCWLVEVDGTHYTIGLLIPREQPDGSTHIIGGGGRTVSLTVAEAVRLAEIEAAERAADRGTPEGLRRALVRERDSATQKWDNTRLYLDEGKCGTDEMAAATREMKEAVQAVTRFDAANPGVRTSEQAEEDRRVLHNLRSLGG
jgi:hypothetical protein